MILFSRDNDWPNWCKPINRAEKKEYINKMLWNVNWNVTYVCDMTKIIPLKREIVFVYNDDDDAFFSLFRQKLFYF